MIVDQFQWLFHFVWGRTMYRKYFWVCPWMVAPSNPSKSVWRIDLSRYVHGTPKDAHHAVCCGSIIGLRCERGGQPDNCSCICLHTFDNTCVYSVILYFNQFWSAHNSAHIFDFIHIDVYLNNWEMWIDMYSYRYTYNHIHIHIHCLYRNRCFSK